MYLIKYILLPSLLLLQLAVYGQAAQERAQILSRLKKSIRFEEVMRFYEESQEEWPWIGHPDRQAQLVTLLQEAENVALDERDYQYAFISSLGAGKAQLKNLEDSLTADIRFTDAALHFFADLKTGSLAPTLKYEGLKYTPDTKELPHLLLIRLKEGNLQKMEGEVQPVSSEYVNAMAMYGRLQKTMEDSTFREVVITSRKITAANQPLLLKLFQLGVCDTVNRMIADKDLVVLVKKVQSLLDLLNDGTLRSTSLTALNVPIARRVMELKRGINYLRWLNMVKQNSFVALVNLPSATLLVHDKGRIVLESKVIVGKRSTPSPTLSSTKNEVILYPYWMVPYKIATRELLPSIKRNIKFLELGGFQVLSKQGKVLNPYSINWSALSAGNFPYIIRQSTGCDNSLGIVKFNFNNPFTVYLHDTPSKSLFTLNKRYFSHGCIRVEKPIELAHIVLGRNRIAIDTVTAKGCLAHQSPMSVAVERQLPIIIMYSTVWYDQHGDIRFYDDVYGKLPQVTSRNKEVSVVLLQHNNE